MALNPNAKEFSFSAAAPVFVPGGGLAPAAAVAPAPTPPSAATAANSSAQPAPVLDSWDEDVPATVPAPAVADVPVPAGSAAAPVPDPTPAKPVNEEVKEVVQPKSKPAAPPPQARVKNKPRKVELKVHDEREHLNIVFIGHVDAGKSTISGQLLLQMGLVDERLIAKYEKEAKEKNRDSWYLAYIMDTSEEERDKGKTVEVGRAHFSSAKKRYTLLDAPGHKNYVPNMIGGAAQADVGILIISARRGEFETGYDKGGQTREHAMLARTLGVNQLVVAVNKMDEATVNWDEKRFNFIKSKLLPFLKSVGYKKEEDVIFVPISGFSGANIKEPVSKEVCPWDKNRRSLLQILDDLPPLKRKADDGVRMPVMARYREMGVLCVVGKLEIGTIRKGDQLCMMPNNKIVDVVGLQLEEEEADLAQPGENVVVRIKGVDEDQVQQGYVLSPVRAPCPVARVFIATLVVLELLEHKPILTAGYQGILHVHSVIAECEIKKLIACRDRKTGKKIKLPAFVKQGAVVTVKIVLEQSIAIETFESAAQLGRFSLRDEGKTIAMGKVMKLCNTAADTERKE